MFPSPDCINDASIICFSWPFHRIYDDSVHRKFNVELKTREMWCRCPADDRFFFNVIDHEWHLSHVKRPLKGTETQHYIKPKFNFFLSVSIAFNIWTFDNLSSPAQISTLKKYLSHSMTVTSVQVKLWFMNLLCKFLLGRILMIFMDDSGCVDHQFS